MQAATRPNNSGSRTLQLINASLLTVIAGLAVTVVGILLSMHAEVTVIRETQASMKAQQEEFARTHARRELQLSVVERELKDLRTAITRLETKRQGN